jgi:ATP-dependent helicase/nuclease subunit B
MTEVCREHQGPQFDRDQARLGAILHETIGRWREQYPPRNENAFRMQCWQMVRTAYIFLQSESELCQTSRPIFFEVALGMERVGGGCVLDDPEPSSISLPSGETIRARGQIDRVDRTSETGYTIWDYKTGSGYGYDRSDPLRQGRRVQSVLYLRMIENALRKKANPAALVECFGYFFPSVRAQGHRVSWNERDLIGGLELIQRICQGIKAGAFIATDNQEDCKYCDYASICRDVGRVTGRSRTLLSWCLDGSLQPFRELRGLAGSDKGEK